MPLVIAPTGLNGALWPDGDVLLPVPRPAPVFRSRFPPHPTPRSRTWPIEREAISGFQLYIVQRALAETLTRRALSAGYKTLMLTVDVAVNGKRERDMRNGFAIPFDTRQEPCWTARCTRTGCCDS